MGASVGYFEAWGLWFQGEDVKDLALYGFPLIWIGRLAKIGTFLASLVVVLDLLGPTKVQRLTARYVQRREGKWWAGEGFTTAAVLAGPTTLMLGVAALIQASTQEHSWWAWILIGLAWIPAVLITIGTVIATAIFLYGLIPRVIIEIAKVLDSERDQNVVRWISFAVIAVGFHFDLLTS